MHTFWFASHDASLTRYNTVPRCIVNINAVNLVGQPERQKKGMNIANPTQKNGGHSLNLIPPPLAHRSVLARISLAPVLFLVEL